MENKDATEKTREKGAARTTMEREEWNARYEGKDLVWSDKANLFVEAELSDAPPGKALVLAAGEGRNAIWLARRGWTVHAVDFSDVAIEKAKKLAAAHPLEGTITFEAADLRGYPFEKEAFDLVTLVYLQIPQSELVPILKGAARSVAPGGELLVIAHDTDNLTHGHGGPQSPKVLYNAQQVVAALDGELSILKAQRVERPVETEDGTKIALDCLVRAKRA